jgi:hypothetical protein
MIAAVIYNADIFGAPNSKFYELSSGVFRARNDFSALARQLRQKELVPKPKGATVGLRRSVDLDVMDHDNIARVSERGRVAEADNRRSSLAGGENRLLPKGAPTRT